MKISGKRWSAKLLVVVFTFMTIISVLAPAAPVLAEEEPVTRILVSGTIVLPEGVAAPDQGLRLNIFVQDESYQSIDDAIAYVEIPAGATSAPFTVGVPENVSAIRLRYILVEVAESGYVLDPSVNYLLDAWYTPAGSTWDAASSASIAPVDAVDLVFPLLTGNLIQGTLSLPDGETVTEPGMQVAIEVCDKDTLNAIARTYLQLQPGQTSSPYRVVVPREITAVIISYNLHGPDPSGLYYHFGVYHESGMVTNYNDATLVDTSSQPTGIDLTMIRSVPVSGLVVLPDGAVAPEHGMTMTIHVMDESGQYINSIYVTMNAGESSAAFSVGVPENVAAVQLSYYLLTNDAGYLREAWYTPGGSTTFAVSAAIIPIEDATGILFPILEGMVIQGTIHLPEGETAPEAGLRVSISAYDKDITQFLASQDCLIEPGLSDVAFALTVPEQLTALQYYVYPEDDPDFKYIRQGWYHPSGTVLWSDQAAPIDPADQTEIDLMVLSRSSIYPNDRYISGHLVLPEGRVAPEGGISGHVRASSEYGSEAYLPYEFYIEEGQNSVAFTVMALDYYMPDAGFKLTYMLYDNTDYMSPGYFTWSGVVTEWNEADIIDVSQGNVEGIEIILPPVITRMISGTVTLPAGRTAPAMGLYGQVQATSIQGTVYSVPFFIPAYENSVAYAVPVQITDINADSAFTVSYDLGWPSANGLFRQGYYTQAGMTPWAPVILPWLGRSSEAVYVGPQDVSGIDLTVIESVPYSGTIRLPDNELASDAIYVSLYLTTRIINAGHISLDYLNIPAGSNSILFSLDLPKVTGDNASPCQLAYSLGNNESGYFHNAYYSPLGTTPDQLAAWPLDLSGPQTGIVMTLLRYNIDIAGQVILPDGAVADQPMEIMIEVRSEHDTYITLDHYVLEAGQNSVDFSLRVPENQQNKGYKLSYQLNSVSDDYYQYGFYTGSDATADSAKAAILDISDGNLDQLFLPLIKGQVLSGQIKLDQGVAPAGGTGVVVFAHFGFSNLTAAYQYVVIEEGQDTVDYTLMFPQDALIEGYTLRYRLITGADGFIANGYRTETGTTSQQQDAGLFTVGPADVDGIDLLIPQNLPVYFADAAFEAAIRQAINRPDGSLMSEHVYGVTALTVSNSGITSLAGIEAFVNLKKLNIEKNLITDVSPLASMTKLTELRLGNNPIADFSPLEPIYANLLVRDFEYNIILETETGSNVAVVEENSGVSLTFTEVSEPLQITVATIYTPPQIDSQIDNIHINTIPVYYEINATETFSGDIIIEIPYTVEQLQGIAESELRLYQYKDGVLTDITLDVDTENKIIRGVMSHFCVFSIGLPNVAPVANAGQDQRVAATSEDGRAWVTLDGSGSYDPDELYGQPIISYEWILDGEAGTISGVSPMIQLPIGVHAITLSVYDGKVESSDTVTIVVYDPDAQPNLPPVADAGLDLLLAAPADGMWVTLDGSGSCDPDDGQSIVGYQWTWDTGTGTETATGIRPEIHLPIGVHEITLTVTDGIDQSSDSVFIVVYDPNGGFATGGGWIDVKDPADGHLGKASFGFIARYKKSSADGNFEFKYQDGDINLKSIRIDWLVVNQNRAQFQGTASLSGKDGLYTFRVALVDNADTKKADTITVRIWEGSDTTAVPIYSAMNVSLSGGNILCKDK